MANNGKYMNGSNGHHGRSSEPWHVGVFAGIGALGFLAILWVSDFVQKHAKTHRSYKDYIFVGMLGFALIAVWYFRHIAKQVWPGAKSMWHSLRWYHWLWFAIFVSGLIFRKRSAAEGVAAPVDNAAVFRICVVGGVGAVLLCLLFMRKVDWFRSIFRGIIGLLLLFDMMCLLSSIWSVYWQWTFYKAVEYGVDIVMLGVVVYVAKSTEEYFSFWNWTWFLYGIMLLNVWFGAVWDPNDALLKGGAYGEQGIGGLGVWLQGVFPDVSSNDLAEYAACLCAVALCRLLPLNRKRENTSWYSFLFLASFVTLIFGQTRSALGGFCIAVFLVYLLSSRVGQGAMIVIGSLMAVIVSGFGDYIFDYLKRGQSANQLESFSSRLEWWEAALRQYAIYPLTGMGMWAAARFGVLAKIGFTNTATIHSDWVEIIVGTGPWGFIPVMVLILFSWWVLVRATINHGYNMEDRQLAYEAMAVLAVVFTRMFFMTDLSRHPPCHFFVVLGAAEFLRRKHMTSETYELAASQLPATASV